MYGIDLLVQEHKNIIAYTEFMRRLCCDILEGKEVDINAFRECVDFGRNYADKHHHGKEEKILFRHMLEKLGPVAEKLVRNGMLSILSTHSCISCTACTSRCLFTLKTKHFLIHSFLSYCRFCGLIIIVTMLLSLFNFSSHLQLQFYCCIHHSYVAVTT